MKKLFAILLAALTLITMCVAASATTSTAATYHSSLVTHYDFDGETPLADKATGGVSSDALTANGDATVNDGVAYVSDAAGAYFSASGADGTDLNSFTNKTIVLKANLSNADGSRSGVAAFVAKGNSFRWILQNQSANNVSFLTMRMNGSNQGSTDTDIGTVGAAMGEWRIYVVTFAYDETTHVATGTTYMSTKEVPESATDFTLVSTTSATANVDGDGNPTDTVLTSASDFLLGKRDDHTEKDRDLVCYFDDVKVYSSVLTLAEVAADAPTTAVATVATTTAATTTAASTTAASTTTASTTKATTTAATTVEDTSAEETTAAEEGGCGSAIGAGSAALIASCAGIASVVKKKKRK